MAKKKRWLLHSQIVGTIWFAVILLAILALAFFFFPQHRSTPRQEVKEQEKIVDLQKKEDSVYRSRRKRYETIKGVRGSEKGVRGSEKGVRGSERTYDSGVARGSTQGYIPTYVTTPPAPTRKALVVELNSADTTTLQLLHGIGPAYARRIVRYRERLGGFCSTDQLLEVYGFTPELLDHLRPYLRLDTLAILKINVNTMTLKQLIKHPYMEYYFARDLVNLRSRGVTFSSPDDLRAIPSCTDTLLVRLLPYLEF